MNSPEIVYEDDYLLALNKPQGFVVNDSNTISNAPSLQDWISKNFNFEISQDKVLRNGLVHRLDKPTSGIILIAKTKDIFEKLQNQFKTRVVAKTYTALVHGVVEPKEGSIDAPIGRLPWKRTKFGVIKEGKEALTNYKVINSNNDYSLLELYPKTGRTHQLRVHLKHIGHPIVGDFLYAGRKTARNDLREFSRLMLHAKSIEFTHPVTNKLIKLETDLPKEFELVLF